MRKLLSKTTATGTAFSETQKILNGAKVLAGAL